jgi:glycosyltransferase involved in cell wall biosynthesis
MEEKVARRLKMREALGIGPSQLCVAFFGKLIPKKQPDLLLEMLPHLVQEKRAKVRLMFVGSGAMEVDLKIRAQREMPGTLFAGFVNQSALPDYYWAADILVLPSRRQGETWGLVVNEALHAGCSVVITDAVGCHAEFEHLERVRVIPVGDAKALAAAICQMALYSRDFDWAQAAMRAYSIDAAAEGFVRAFAKIAEYHSKQ